MDHISPSYSWTGNTSLGTSNWEANRLKRPSIEMPLRWLYESPYLLQRKRSQKLENLKHIIKLKPFRGADH